jgi:hypothetical protein
MQIVKAMHPTLKKITTMKTLKPVLLGLLAVSTIIMVAFTFNKEKKAIVKKPLRPIPKGCVFMTVMGEEKSDSFYVYKTPEKVEQSVNKGLEWIVKAQNSNGGWGAGSHYQQEVMDPHAVKTDPATTSMVAMALLRAGSTFTSGEYSSQLRKALIHLLNAVETASPESPTITTETGTQIQTKLGANIDVILTAQFLTNTIEYLDFDSNLKSRVKRNLQICVNKIQKSQETDGSFAGGSWAGVLQSALANNALESAQLAEVVVDDKILKRSREYQKGNIDAKSGDVKTDRGAGIVLYSVSGSARATAKGARKVEEEMKKAKETGKLAQNAPVTVQNLEALGYSKDEALEYSTSYEVYQAGKGQAQRDDVLAGFGNNGGEEFLSYLQTGESMIIGKDNSWKTWYDNTSGRLLKIQNDNGSWNGHHCITSPVFCTATCLLILSVNNDVDRLEKIGK